ncbi:hypothetical protein [Nonomuraea sp. NEAU-A123]|uniref:hypothetical protein n=1 Tax=Nonomuraea sp. NEAU-A123 TaxID=2839649 RepID=UPI001BE47BFE|nr:hypothetical protein [Nonomuraea sp. NEAU-A123]MBT2226728.1 hypothetical protein [Nonomuraea sp. NEAU-A123]
MTPASWIAVTTTVADRCGSPPVNHLDRHPVAFGVVRLVDDTLPAVSHVGALPRPRLVAANTVEIPMPQRLWSVAAWREATRG